MWITSSSSGSNSAPPFVKQQLDERIEKGDVALGRFQREGIDARAVFADAVHAAAVQFDHAFVAAADVEDVGESAVLLLVGDGQVAVHGFAGSRWPEDEHDAHAVHIHVLKERRPRARLEDVQVLVVEVFRIRMAEIRREDRRQPRMMVFGQPHGEDVELLVAGKHGVERRQVAQASLP